MHFEACWWHLGFLRLTEAIPGSSRDLQKCCTDAHRCIFGYPCEQKYRVQLEAYRGSNRNLFFALVRKKNAVSRLIEAHRGSNRDLFRFVSLIFLPQNVYFFTQTGIFFYFFSKGFPFRIWESYEPNHHTSCWTLILLPREASKNPRCHQQSSKCIPWGVRGTFIWVCLMLQANCFLNPFKQHFGKIANSLNCTFTLRSSWDLLLKALQSHLHKALQIYGQMFYIFV